MLDITIDMFSRRSITSAKNNILPICTVTDLQLLIYLMTDALTGALHYAIMHHAQGY